jgi:DNA-binding CsgD family transcriptional regulator
VEDLVVTAEHLHLIVFILGRVLPCDALAWVSMSRLALVADLTIWTPDASAPPRLSRVAASRVAELLDRSGRVRLGRAEETVPDRHGDVDPADLPLAARHRLGIATGADPVEGWILARNGAEFTATDLDLAELLIHSIRAAAAAPVRRADAPPPVLGTPTLTARERQMLELVGTGLTALAISHRTGISVRTVHKHLQNAYAKLGCGDRLSAVLKVRAQEPGAVRFPVHPASTGSGR